VVRVRPVAGATDVVGEVPARLKSKGAEKNTVELDNGGVALSGGSGFLEGAKGMLLGNPWVALSAGGAKVAIKGVHNL
jgi:hypothetical protein